MPRKERLGTVVSDKMQKTRVVKVEERQKHPRFGKVHIVTNKFKIHDENNTSVTGDVVRFGEYRPLSKDKRWILLEVIKHTEEV